MNIWLEDKTAQKQQDT